MTKPRPSGNNITQAGLAGPSLWPERNREKMKEKLLERRKQINPVVLRSYSSYNNKTQSRSNFKGSHPVLSRRSDCKFVSGYSAFMG